MNMERDLLQYLPSKLVVTPKPQHGESYMGFVLRTAEANGYPSINTVLRHAGMTENEMRSARPPLEKLAPLYGRTVEDFAVLGETRTANGRFLPLMNQPLPAIYLRSKHARVCPECVRDHGHIQAFWEMRHAVACPAHGRMALSQCPQCHRPIDWWRRGLTTCSCGHDFAHHCGEKVANAAVLVLLEAMQDKLMSNALNEGALRYAGFPVEAMNGMSLATLLGILDRLENFLLPAENDQSSSPEWLALEIAAGLFSAWPTGFHRYMEQVHGPQASMQAKGLRGQFDSFYEAFFKQGLPREEIVFLHQAFVEFGEQHWKQATIHPRLTSGKASNIVGIEGLAKAIGVQPSTARKLVAKGVIPVHADHPKNGRKLFDLSQQLPFEFAEGESLSLEAAAEVLDIPAAILRAYRSRGYYSQRYLASPAVLYHERDVEALSAELVQDCPQINVQAELRYTTLRKVMLKKLGPSEVKASFIDAVRKREIRPLGIAGDRPGDLVFDAREVKDFLDRIDIKIAGSVSIEHGQKSLGVNQSAIVALGKAGLLELVCSDFGIRITEASLQSFSARYASCRQIAKLKGMTKKELMALCKELHLGVLHLESNTAESIFIDRHHAMLLGIHSDPSLNLLEAA
jgi:hypothetical protein